MDFIEFLKVLVLGIVEGFTEWLPISSTGHMILVDEIIHLNVTDAFMSMFRVVIQLGAILAVVVLYFRRLNPFDPGKTRAQKVGTVKLWMKIVVACIPAAILGLLLDDWMDAHLYNGYVVAATLIIYGVLFIVLENHNQYTANRPDFLSDRIFHRPVPGAFPGARYLPFRFYHSGSHDPGLLPQCGCRVFLFPGNPGHVWREPVKAVEVRVPFYRTGAVLSDCRYGDRLCSIGVLHQVPDGLHQKK